MSVFSKEDLESLLSLVPVGIVVAAAIGLFYGVGFLWLIHPDPVGTPAASIARAPAPESDEVAPLRDNATERGSSSDFFAENVAANPLTASAHETMVLGTTRRTGMDPALIPPTTITHAKRVRLARYHRPVTERHWARLWRPDASAGPNPGGGFYGPPNVNIGYINPR